MNKLVRIIPIIGLGVMLLLSQLTIHNYRSTIASYQNIFDSQQHTIETLKQTIAIMDTTITNQQDTLGLCQSAISDSNLQSSAESASDWAKKVWDVDYLPKTTKP